MTNKHQVTAIDDELIINPTFDLTSTKLNGNALVIKKTSTKINLPFNLCMSTLPTYAGMDQSLLGYQHHDAVSSFSSISACVTLFDYTCDARQVTETGVYFAEPQLRPGNTMTLTLPAEAAPAILPRDVAEKVPFGNLDDVLAAFDIPVGSPEAAQVGHTLIRCQTPPATGEVKSCTTSLEATVQSAMNMLGSTTGRDEDVWVAASEISSAGLLRQPYVVQAVTPIQGSRYVPCHPMPFPYTVFQCHVARAEGYRAHKVSLRGVHDGSTVAMLAFCHLDTYGWNPTHPVFKLLQTRPGVGPVCHFMPYGNLAFVKMATTASA